MTRDNALKIAKRILDRIEQDRAVHLDAVADEIVAGMALVTPRPEQVGKQLAERHQLIEKQEPCYTHGLTGTLTVPAGTVIPDKSAIYDVVLHGLAAIPVSGTYFTDLDLTINGWTGEAMRYIQRPASPPSWDSAKSKQRYGRAEARSNGWSAMQMYDAGYKLLADSGDWVASETSDPSHPLSRRPLGSAVVQREGGPPPALPGNTVSPAQRIANGWSQDDMKDAGWIVRSDGIWTHP